MPEYNPETILEEQFESQRQQIQKQFQTQWDDVNRQARDNLFKSPKEHEAALHDLYTQNKQIMSEFDQKAGQATGQLQQIDKLAEMGAIQNPDEVKWRMVLGPEAERGMFPPEPRDPRLEHRDILAEENRLFQTVGSFAMGRDGKLYQADVKNGEYTDQPDKSKPASQQEIALFTASADALSQLEQRKLGLVESMADQGIPNPNRLQDLMISREKEGFFRKYANIALKYSPAAKAIGTQAGLIQKGMQKVKTELGVEPTGTFAQKVQQDVAPSLTQQRTQQPRTVKPQTGKKLTKKIAMQYLMQHGNRQDAMAAARADGYTE